jgi:hypothetical protein
MRVVHLLVGALSAGMFVAAAAIAEEAAAPASQGRPPECQSSIPVLSGNVEQIAKVIEVLPLVQRLGPGCRPDGVMSVEELGIRQQIAEAVLTASLDLEGVLAEIDCERAQNTGRPATTFGQA